MVLKAKIGLKKLRNSSLASRLGKPLPTPFIPSGAESSLYRVMMGTRT
jgi:hypothetical protein